MPDLLGELIALQEARDAANARAEMLDEALDTVLTAVPVETLARLPDDLLRRIFSRLPSNLQDQLHPRLFPKAAE